MKLIEIVNQIKINQEVILEFDRKILGFVGLKHNFNEQLEAYKLAVCKGVYFSDSYKNDKQREITVKEIYSDSATYQELSTEVSGLEKDIQETEYKKSLAMIDLAYYKNLLRVAEIEAMKVKAGV